MKLLKIKAWIYQNTGIFLAHKEQLKYLDSRDFWVSFDKIQKKENRSKYKMGSRNIYGILLGTWQAHNGLYREYKRRR